MSFAESDPFATPITFGVSITKKQEHMKMDEQDEHVLHSLLAGRESFTYLPNGQENDSSGEDNDSPEFRSPQKDGENGLDGLQIDEDEEDDEGVDPEYTRESISRPRSAKHRSSKTSQELYNRLFQSSPYAQPVVPLNSMVLQSTRPSSAVSSRRKNPRSPRSARNTYADDSSIIDRRSNQQRVWESRLHELEQQARDFVTENQNLKKKQLRFEAVQESYRRSVEDNRRLKELVAEKDEELTKLKRELDKKLHLARSHRSDQEGPDYEGTVRDLFARSMQVQKENDRLHFEVLKLRQDNQSLEKYIPNQQQQQEHVNGSAPRSSARLMFGDSDAHAIRTSCTCQCIRHQHVSGDRSATASVTSRSDDDRIKMQQQTITKLLQINKELHKQIASLRSREQDILQPRPDSKLTR
eukprot:GILJ01003148.1.p1 GENE.GILJ01003148.1~~GILJ01003148.1.p1  ORF type:complete len:412 (-),score=65.66 GILJ01003148.1:100-1335(-)